MHITTLLLLGLLKTSTGIHLKKRAYSQDCANLSGVALNVDMGDGTTYYAGDIAGCGCASEEWVENTVSNSLDDAVSNAVSVAGLDATVSAITSLVRPRLYQVRLTLTNLFNSDRRRQWQGYVQLPGPCYRQLQSQQPL